MPTKKTTDYTKKVKDINDPVRAEVTQDAPAVTDIKNTSSTPDTRDEFRFSARFTPDEWSFLQEKKWRTRKSITAILQEYVDKDMEDHPNILKQRDELNW